MREEKETDRISNNLTWAILDLDGADCYDEKTNTVRVKKKSGSSFRLFLAFTGSFTEADPERFRAACFYPGNFKPQSTEAVANGIAFLVEAKRFEHWKLKSSALPTAQIGTGGEAGRGRDTVIKGQGGESASGISIRDDGTMVLKGKGSEIIMGDGIVIKGEIHRANPETRNSILKSNPLRAFSLPSFCALPIPAELPTFRLISNIGGIIRSASKML